MCALATELPVSELLSKASRLASVVDLVDISLVKSSFDIAPELPDPPYGVTVTITPAVQIEGESIVYSFEYDVKGEKDGSDVLSISCTFRAIYSSKEKY